MDLKQVIKGITVLMLAGAALDAVCAETAAAQPAAEVHAADAAAAPEAAQAQPPVTDPAPVRAADEAAGQDAHPGEPAADAGDKPYSIGRALSGLGDLFERAKNFVTQSGK